MATRDQLYAKFGIMAEAAQLYEHDLGTILLAIKGERRGWHVVSNPTVAVEVYEKLNRKTLGQLLDQVKRFISLDEDVEALFEEALAARNRLSHGFFERHNFAIQSAQGRDAMIAELEALHQQLFDAWQVSQRLAAALVDRLVSARE